MKYAIELTNAKKEVGYLYKEQTKLKVSSILTPECLFENKVSATFFIKINNVHNKKVKYKKLEIVEINTEPEMSVIYEVIEEKKLYMKIDPKTQEFYLEEGLKGACTFLPDLAIKFAERLQETEDYEKLYTEKIKDVKIESIK